MAKPAKVIDRYKKLPAPSTKIEASIRSVILAQAYARMDLAEKAEEILKIACEAAEGDSEATLVAADELGSFLWHIPRNKNEAAHFFMLAGEQAERIASPLLRSTALLNRAYSFSSIARHEEAIAAATEAATLAADADGKGNQSESLQLKAFSLGQLGHHEECIATAAEAAALAAQAGDKSVQAPALRHKAVALGRLGRYEESIATATEAAALAAQAGDKDTLAAALRHKAFSLGQLDRNEESFATATEAAALAADAGDKFEQSLAFQYKAFSLGRLGRHEESIATATEAAAFAAQAGDKSVQAAALRCKAFSLGKLDRHEDGVKTYAKAMELATEAGDIREVALANLELSWLIEKLNRSEDAFSHAGEAWKKSMESGDQDTVRMAATQAINIAMDTPQPKIIDLFRQWIDRQASDGEDQIALSWLIAEFLAAATRVRAWPELDMLLDRYGEWLAKRIEPLPWFGSIGDVIARVAADEARAAGFDAAQGILNRLVKLYELRPKESEWDNWLADIVQSLSEQCHDAGLLRDVAGLLTKELSPDAPLQGRLLESLADFDAAGDHQPGVLARMDPDIALWIRQIRDLPEDAATSSKKEPKKKKRKKR